MFVFFELDGFTRKHMRQEFMLDKEQDILYQSRVMTEAGLNVFPALLLEALNGGTIQSLAAKLDNSTYWGPQARNDSHQALAEEQFNQYYMRGLTSKLMVEGIAQVEIYLANQDGSARRRGAQPGDLVDCTDALADLRDTERHLIRGKTGLVRGSKSGICLKRVGQRAPR